MAYYPFVPYFKHETALVESPTIGDGTRIWAFAHVLPGARIGRECNICDHTFVENDVVIGDRVTIKSGVQLWDGVTIEDDVFIGPNATFTNDPYPRSKHRPESYGRTLIQQGASIGANATILPGLVVGSQAMIGAGAVLTNNAPPAAIMTGNPARITGYVGATQRPALKIEAPATPGKYRSDVEGVTLIRLPQVEDARGQLSFAEIGPHLPFEVKRYFLVFGVASQEVRGEHAHKDLHQFLTCVHGACHLMIDDGRQRQEVVLDSPSFGVHVPPMIWSVQYKYTPDAVLLVLASDFYDPDDYIRDYAEFQRLRAS
jgi:acetyltransferase-like isoleucine patch superfamily enzyme/dTDP-4-dehydrorhamnose 3,5-epimerase-like enzyme